MDGAQITNNSSITVPYGTRPAYENSFTAPINNVPSPIGKSYLTLNLGLLKQTNTQVDASRGQAVLDLSQTGTEPFSFFPLRTGTRLIYNASDSATPTPHTWQMQIDVLNQVTLSDDGQTYFHLRQKNYDPYDPNGGPNLSQDFYARSTASQVLSYNPGDADILQYQAAGPTTTWDADGKTKLITGITPVNVLGSAYLAYLTRQTEGINPPMDEYVVPGLGTVKIVDQWTNPSNRAPLNFTLAKVTQTGANPALMLLLQ